MTALRLAFLALLAVSSSGCALTSKADPLEVRYFSAEVRPDARSGAAGILELRRVLAASHLTTRMLRRVSEHEYAYSETRRWTDDPAEYLRRGLERALYQTGTLKAGRGADAVVLEVELTGFEAHGEVARVALSFSLFDQRVALAYQDLEASAPLADPQDPAAVAEALRAALSKAIAQVVSRVDAALAARAR